MLKFKSDTQLLIEGKNLNEDELNMLSESIDNILKLIPKIT